ncbi:hypothetical protein [Paraburkholderia hospita]|uniref:hypothetical protein n=1 Tax=Paraburkholderia hospita TaxID=169430 RepID=UPI0008A79EF6|nr:hypothetical protein [Paraburkholderia hospita]SEH89779.1 hypothetical protein SAMN05192544_1011147 [Paraburkholderia hospita]
MNVYALNETPINGWATLYGGGNAVEQLTLSGVSANVVMGGGSADLNLSPAGNGTRWTFGASQADLALNESGNGTRRTIGTGDASNVLVVNGDGTTTRSLGGMATLLLSWIVGKGGVIVHGSGEAALALMIDANGRAAIGRHGSGDMRMVLSLDGRGILPPVVHAGGKIEEWLYLTGYPNMIAHAGGAADMRMLAAGDSHAGHRVFASGEIVLGFELGCNWTSKYREVYGSSSIVFGFSLEARDARVAMLPSTFYAAPKSRGARVEREIRLVRVDRASGALHVKAETPLLVPKENRSMSMPNEPREPGSMDLLRYADGTPAFDLMADSTKNGEPSTVSAIDTLEPTVTDEMPNNSWAPTP